MHSGPSAAPQHSTQAHQPGPPRLLNLRSAPSRGVHLILVDLTQFLEDCRRRVTQSCYIQMVDLQDAGNGEKDDRRCSQHSDECMQSTNVRLDGDSTTHGGKSRHRTPFWLDTPCHCEEPAAKQFASYGCTDGPRASSSGHTGDLVWWQRGERPSSPDESDLSGLSQQPPMRAASCLKKSSSVREPCDWFRARRCAAIKATMIAVPVERCRTITSGAPTSMDCLR